MKSDFKESISKAVNNTILTGALGKFSEAYKVNRAKAYEGIDFEALRQNIADRKAYAATHIDLLAAAFKIPPINRLEQCSMNWAAMFQYQFTSPCPSNAVALIEQ